MIPYLLAQSEFNFSALFEAILSQYGALFTLLAIVGFMIFLTWRSQMSAENERNKQDVKRDSVINDYAAKYGELSQTVATQGIALAKAEGKVDLLTTQLETERDKRQKEREELKAAIRDLSDKLKKYEDEIAELKESLNGKDKHIQSLELERDKLLLELKERDAKLLHLERELSELKESKRHLEAKVMEQSEQMVVLIKQIAELEDKLKSPVVTTTESHKDDTIKLPDIDEKKEETT